MSSTPAQDKVTAYGLDQVCEDIANTVPLTFHGVPVVFDETMADGGRRLYVIVDGTRQILIRDAAELDPRQLTPGAPGVG